MRRHNASGGTPAARYTYNGPIAGVTVNELGAYKSVPVDPKDSFEHLKLTQKVFEDLSSTLSLQAAGTTAISRVNPTKQQAGLMVAMRETYNDGIPKVPGVNRKRVEQALRDYREKRRSGVVKGSAEEYLNFVFGILPLLADAKSLHGSIKNFEKNYNQFVRNAGKTVRRSYTFPKVEQPAIWLADEVRTGGWPSSVLTNTSLFSGVVNRPHKHYKVVSRHQKFSGAFTYYLDEGSAPLRKLLKLNAEADFLFGGGLTIENLWNSSPWTWFVDWFSNTGDVIANLSSVLADNLVLRYGYMQEHTYARHFCDCSVVSAKQSGGPSVPVLRDNQYVIEAKQRIRATPFGFGLSEAGLSTKQKLILAALGITRV